jgi:O-antigen/teichoic acid export membrane protein
MSCRSPSTWSSPASQVGAGSFGAFTVGLTVTTVLAGIAPLGRDQAVVRYVAIYRGREAPRQVRARWSALVFAPP